VAVSFMTIIIDSSFHCAWDLRGAEWPLSFVVRRTLRRPRGWRSVPL
jgi:hypothetical protein